MFCTKDWPTLPNVALRLSYSSSQRFASVLSVPVSREGNGGTETSPQLPELTQLEEQSLHGLVFEMLGNALLHNVTPTELSKIPPSPQRNASSVLKMQIQCGWSSGCESS